MPEGDTIYRIARRFRPLLVGQTVRAARSRWDAAVRGLVGRAVTSIETRGKQMLVLFDDDTALRVHLGIDGRWHVYKPGDRWRLPAAQMGLVLETDEHELACFSPRPVERIPSRRLSSHKLLAALGPDALDAPFALQTVCERARRPENAERDIAEVLLDQTVSAGVGNVYKSEAMFLERVHPWTATADLTDERLAALFTRASSLMQDNLSDRARNTTRRSDRRLWVYGAMRGNCLQCGAEIAWEHQGPDRRITWWCPRCQSGEEIA